MRRAIASVTASFSISSQRCQVTFPSAIDSPSEGLVKTHVLNGKIYFPSALTREYKTESGIQEPEFRMDKAETVILLFLFSSGFRLLTPEFCLSLKSMCGHRFQPDARCVWR